VHEGNGSGNGEGSGGHRFEIHADAAWDHLEPPAADPAAPAELLYFGSLAQRAPASRRVIRQVAKRFTGLRLLDLNMRPGTDGALFAAESLMLADWVKLNDEELDRLLLDFDCADVAALMGRFALQRLLITRGPDGWTLYGPGGNTQAAGPGEHQPALVDTVGAGDSFTAMLLAGLALGRDLALTLQLANRYAAMICGVRGPLPEPQALAPWREALHALPLEAHA
jgi:fructokinase